MQPKVEYGRVETTEIIDGEGSTLTVEKKVEAGVVLKPRRLRYEIRHRTDVMDIEAISKLGKSLINDPMKLDASLKFERTKYGSQNGYYHIVECYTILEY